MPIRSSLSAHCVRLGILMAAVACGNGASGNNSSTGPTTPPVVSTIAVTLNATSLVVGQTAQAQAAGTDGTGAPVNLGTVTWSSSNPAVATVTSTGLVTAISAGTSAIVAAAAGKSGQATLTVTTDGVASVIVTPAAATLIVGTTQQLTVTTRDASGTVLTGRAVSWSSSDPTRATVGPTGLVTAIAAGTATIVATSENKSGSATITVTASSPPPPTACAPSNAQQLALGEIRVLTDGQMSSLCLGGMTSASEYVLIPFNNSNVASSTTQIELSSTNTSAPTGATSVRPSPATAALRRAMAMDQMESGFRTRELHDVGALSSRARLRGVLTPSSGAPNPITGLPANPVVGTVVPLNINLNGNTCTDPPIRHPARIVAVLQHAIIMIDTLSPPGGYTDAQLESFGAFFDTVGFALDTTNFGTPTDIDNNGRMIILFTPGINEIPGPVGGTIGGLFAARDLFPATAAGCTASNVGEMFYMPVPDPNQTINGNYTSISFLSSLVPPTLVHEFQHLINAGRRIYVNDAPTLEEVWLNEGLSHIAEELLYYHNSGNAPGQNIDLARVTSSQAQINAFNNDQSQNFGRLSSYLGAPSSNSPFAEIDGLAMRGAIWQLLRYSADQKGGTQRSIWYPLVNSTTSGQANYDAVFGDIIANTRNWAVAQYVDDIGLSVPMQYTNPSWNFRSVFNGLGSKVFPLVTSSLVSGTNVQTTIVGGGAAYVRFHVNAGVAAGITATSVGQQVPANVAFILVRTQ